MSHFDFDILRRKSAFQVESDLTMEPEFTEDKCPKPFFDVPDLYPFVLKDNLSSVQGIDFTNPEHQKDFLLKVESIKSRKVHYEKPIAIIINPNSGKKIDLMPMIASRLEEEQIPFEWIPTKKVFDTFTLSYNLAIDKYSAIVVCGGDGSYHEVMNGMMARPDGKRLPIGLIPNGSGNDIAHSLGVDDLETALNAIVKAQVIKSDAYRVMTDKRHEEVPIGEEGFEFRRYA